MFSVAAGTFQRITPCLYLQEKSFPASPLPLDWGGFRGPANREGLGLSHRHIYPLPVSTRVQRLNLIAGPVFTREPLRRYYHLSSRGSVDEAGISRWLSREVLGPEEFSQALLSLLEKFRHEDFDFLYRDSVMFMDLLALTKKAEASERFDEKELTYILKSFLSIFVSYGFNVNFGVHVNGVINQPSTKPLYFAAFLRTSALTRALLAIGADVDAAVNSKNPRTALHLSAWEGNREITGALLESGACPDGGELALKNRGETPLIAGAYHPDCVDLLIQHGADVNHWSSNSVFGETALRSAVSHGVPQSVERILEAGAFIDREEKSHLVRQTVMNISQKNISNQWQDRSPIIWRNRVSALQRRIEILHKLVGKHVEFQRDFCEESGENLGNVPLSDNEAKAIKEHHRRVIVAATENWRSIEESLNWVVDRFDRLVEVLGQVCPAGQTRSSEESIDNIRTRGKV